MQIKNLFSMERLVFMYFHRWEGEEWVCAAENQSL